MLAPVTNRPPQICPQNSNFFSHVTIQRSSSIFPIYVIHGPVIPTLSRNYCRHREVIKEISPGKMYLSIPVQKHSATANRQ